VLRIGILATWPRDWKRRVKSVRLRRQDERLTAKQELPRRQNEIFARANQGTKLHEQKRKFAIAGHEHHP
jgi:hypothetical protein